MVLIGGAEEQAVIRWEKSMWLKKRGDVCLCVCVCMGTWWGKEVTKEALVTMLWYPVIMWQENVIIFRLEMETQPFEGLVKGVLGTTRSVKWKCCHTKTSTHRRCLQNWSLHCTPVIVHWRRNQIKDSSFKRGNAHPNTTLSEEKEQPWDNWKGARTSAYYQQKAGVLLSFQTPWSAATKATLSCLTLLMSPPATQ
jgi:hypothetical protein